MAKIGILGGTFNPIHLGHIDVGLQLINDLQLDWIFYVVSAHPPHKKLMTMPTAEERLEMIRQTLAAFPKLQACDIELQREAPSWTIDTIEALQLKYPDDQLFFICGSESFLRLPTWKAYRRLLNTISFIVILRRVENEKKIRDLLLREGLEWREANSSLGSPPAVFIWRGQGQFLDLSATQIRRLMRNHQDFSSWISPALQKYLGEKKLYEYL